MKKSIDDIIPSLTIVKGDVAQISSIVSSVNIQLSTFKASSSVLLGSLSMITPVVYSICSFFIIQGLAFISLSFHESKKQ